MLIRFTLRAIALLLILEPAGCASQRWEHFTFPTPIAAEDTLNISFWKA